MTRKFGRVMLVAPPGRCTPDGSFQAVPPEGLARIAAWLRRDGYEVAILDALIEGYEERVAQGNTVRYGLSAARTAAMIAEWEPDIVGLSCLFTCVEPDVLEIARACRSLRPATPIVLGGAHAAYTARALLAREPAVDYVALSEGEAAFAALLECLNEGGQPAAVGGFASRGAGGEVRARPLQQFLDLDRLPFPAWDLLPLEAYNRAGAPHFGISRSSRYVPTSWSRGCINACSFCLTPRLWGRGNHRKRTPGHIVEEIRWLRAKLQIEELHVEDDCLLPDRDWLFAVLDAVAGEDFGLRLDFANSLDVNLVDDAIAAKMARAGGCRVGLSFDTGEGNERNGWVGKQVALETAHSAVAAMRAHGISMIGYFMLGFPGQTIADMEAIVEYALALDLDYLSLFVATPFPGSPLHTYCEREGLLVNATDPRDFRFSFGHIQTDEFGPADTERLRREGYLEFLRRRGSG